MRSILNLSDNEIIKNYPSLKHGKKFKKYQNQILNSLEKEGFSNMEDNTLTKETSTIINKNNYSNQEQIIVNLRQEYQDTLQQYEDLVKKSSGKLTDYIDRVNPNNPYLNKTIRFITGHICYVTNQGVVKYIKSRAIWNSVNVPKNYIDINIPWQNSYSIPGTMIPTIPPLVSGTFMEYGQSVGNEGLNIFVNQFLPKNTEPTYIGCYATNSANNNMTFIGGSPTSTKESNGTYSYDHCKEAAISSGNRYFALQNVNTSSNLGYCAVSNSQPSITQYGTSQVPNKTITLWSSGLDNQIGNTATLDGGGTLQIINSDGKTVFTTPLPYSVKTESNPYIGCFTSNNLKNISQIGEKYKYTSDECMDAATEQNAMYVGYGGATRGNKIKHCLIFNDLKSSQMNGISKNCNKPNGGNKAVAVYATDNSNSNGNCFLILQDDGNMVIYRGTGPNDNQGAIWSTKTNGKQLQANPQMTASKGKYGKNWIASGSTLAAGDFISSKNGNLALVMQTDGNLVLYTYEMETNCKKMSDGTIGGGLGANAAYDIGKKAVSGNMGAIGYIDSNSNLYTYPRTNQKYTNTYQTIINGLDTTGNDIPSGAFGNTTIEKCQSACNKNKKCAGFVTNTAENYCWLKTSGMYPFGGSSTPNLDRNIYVRDIKPSKPPLGVSSNTTTTDSVTYNKYINKGLIGSQYGLANATNAQKQELEQLQSRMNLLSSQITELTNKFQGGSKESANQSTRNNSVIDKYLKDMITTNSKIGEPFTTADYKLRPSTERNIASNIGDNSGMSLLPVFDMYQPANGIKAEGMSLRDNSSNIDNILKDSDIVVLQKNYDYLFWSILAAGTVLVSMNILKK